MCSKKYDFLLTKKQCFAIFWKNKLNVALIKLHHVMTYVYAHLLSYDPRVEVFIRLRKVKKIFSLLSKTGHFFSYNFSWKCMSTFSHSSKNISIWFATCIIKRMIKNLSLMWSKIQKTTIARGTTIHKSPFLTTLMNNHNF